MIANVSGILAEEETEVGEKLFSSVFVVRNSLVICLVKRSLM